VLLADMQEASRITGRTVEGTKVLLRREGVKTMPHEVREARRRYRHRPGPSPAVREVNERAQ